MKKVIVFLSGFLFLVLPNRAYSQSSPVHVYLFYAENCPSCGGILTYLPALKSTYPFLEVKTFDVGNPIHYEALVKLEKQFGRPGNELPVAFIGGQILAGEQEIMEKLDPLILEYQLGGGISLSPVEVASSTGPSGKRFSVDLAYFYQKGCPKCDRANYLLNYLSRKYPRLRIKAFDISTLEGKRLNETLSNRLNLSPEKRLTAPSIFIGQDCLLPGEITEPRVEALIQKYEQIETSFTLSMEKEEIKQAEASVINRFKSLGILTVLSAGLIDGLNPCAFATLIFFISYLTFIGRKKREILWVGLGFSGAVFAAYSLIGIGIFSSVQHLSFMPLFSRVAYLITLVAVLVLGGYSLYDYFQLKKGKPSRMKLQLPDFLKKTIHRVIREKSRSHHYFIAAVVAGIIISLLEFTCTGQVYLPTILFVTTMPSLRGNAIFYLVLYNLMFIIPLLTIFGAAYWGVSSDRFSSFLQRRASTIKLLTALLFFTLAGILVMMRGYTS